MTSAKRILADSLHHVGQELFMRDDAFALAHSWQIQASRGGLSRVYRDPRFAQLKQSPTYRLQQHGSHPDHKQTWARTQFAFTTVARPNPALIIWRWRYELTLAAGLPASAVFLASRIGMPLAVLSFLTVAGAIGVPPAARRLATARAWCVITPHRIRSGLAQAWIHTRQGKIPIILLTRAQPYGERVRIWCRAGTCIEDLHSALPQLTAACWAHELRLARSDKFAQLITIDVIRRPVSLRPSGSSPAVTHKPRSSVT